MAPSRLFPGVNKVLCAVPDVSLRVRTFCRRRSAFLGIFAPYPEAAIPLAIVAAVVHLIVPALLNPYIEPMENAVTVIGSGTFFLLEMLQLGRCCPERVNFFCDA